MDGKKKTLKEALEPIERLLRVRWVWCLVVVLGVIGGYYALAMPVVDTGLDPILATLVIDAVAVVIALALRLWRPGWFTYDPTPDGRSTWRFWAVVAGGLVLAFLAGQTLAFTAYGLLGSPTYDQVSEGFTDSAPGVRVALTLLIAPMCEEALLRGLVYPLLRRRVGPLAAMIVTTIVFALMHGNVVQISVTLPFALLLTMVYERTRSLVQPTLLHVGFNLAATFVPPTFVAALTTPLCTTMLVCACAVWLSQLYGAVVPPAPLRVEEDETCEG